jgi:hypothetical protein
MALGVWKYGTLKWKKWCLLYQPQNTSLFRQRYILFCRCDASLRPIGLIQFIKEALLHIKPVSLQTDTWNSSPWLATYPSPKIPNDVTDTNTQHCSRERNDSFVLMGSGIKSQKWYLNNDSELSHFFSLCPDKCRESILSVFMTAFFQIPAHSCITVTLEDTSSEVVPTSSKTHKYIVEFHWCGRQLSGSPVIRIGQFVDNCTKLSCLEITGYRIKYSRVLWLLELQIRQGGKV